MIHAPHRFAAPPADRRHSWSHALTLWWRPVLFVASAVALITFIVHHRTVRVHLPDFAAIEDTTARKAAFFDYLAPLAQAVNAELSTPRKRLLAIDEALAAGWSVDPAQRGFVQAVASRHDIEPAEEIDRVYIARLLSRVDAVPPSLILAQAALESGWGTSRFARQGNSLFGMRCYKPGCGIVPAQRPAGSKFEVAAYPDPAAAIRAYVHNLNTHPRYRALRRIRAEYRAENRPLSGADLAAGLTRYSELGSDYVQRVLAIITDNDLTRFDG